MSQPQLLMQLAGIPQQLLTLRQQILKSMALEHRLLNIPLNLGLLIPLQIVRTVPTELLNLRLQYQHLLAIHNRCSRRHLLWLALPDQLLLPLPLEIAQLRPTTRTLVKAWLFSSVDGFGVVVH